MIPGGMQHGWSLFLVVVSISCYREGKQFTTTSMITLFSNLPGQYSILKLLASGADCSQSDYGQKKQNSNYVMRLQP